MQLSHGMHIVNDLMRKGYSSSASKISQCNLTCPGLRGLATVAKHQLYDSVVWIFHSDSPRIQIYAFSSKKNPEDINTPKYHALLHLY